MGKIWPKFSTTYIFSEILGNQVISMKITSNMSNNVTDINILQNQVKIFKLR